MPFKSSAASRYKYAAINKTQHEYVKISGQEQQHGGSDVIYHEMEDIESNEESSSIDGMDSFKRPMHVWPVQTKVKRWNVRRKSIFLLCFVLFLVIVVAVFMYLYVSDQHESCTSRSCIIAAGNIASSLDEDTDPCDDFYQFACGGWKSNNPIPSGHLTWDAFSIQEKYVNKALKNLLEKDSQNSSKDSSAYKARLLYRACMDVDSINSQGSQPLVSLIDQLGGWNGTGNWSSDDFDFNSLLPRLAEYNIPAFFTLVVGPDLKNTTRNILRLGEIGLTVGDQDFYINKSLEDPFLDAYHKYMTEVAVLLGGDKGTSERIMKQVLLFEQQLAEIQRPTALQSLAVQEYHYMTVAELEELCSAIQWMRFINSSTVQIIDDPIGPNEPIGTSADVYINKLSDLIMKTPNETLNAYMIWQLVSSSISGLGNEFKELQQKLNKEIYGMDPSCFERWKWCVSAVDRTLGFPLARLFVEKHFDFNSRQMAEVMVGEIKDSFRRKVPNIQWLDKETGEIALEKVDAVKDAIGFPDAIFNVTQMDADFMELNYTNGSSFFDMLADFRKFALKEMVKELRKPVNDDEWSMTPPTLNAYYSTTSNKIVFPAGILQPPAYKSDYPQSVNFGGIGFVVGHELTHGFDVGGRKFDLHGNLKNWWKKETLKRFMEKSECMAEQYSMYEYMGFSINGNLTLEENIADNGGLRLAYDAYMNWRKSGDGKNDPVLPSLGYSHEQLFFISFAQMWCASDTPKFAKRSMLSAHCPSEIRVLGAAKNMPEFSKAFQCPSGSKMNPKKKCVVW